MKQTELPVRFQFRNDVAPCGRGMFGCIIIQICFAVYRRGSNSLRDLLHQMPGMHTDLPKASLTKCPVVEPWAPLVTPEYTSEQSGFPWLGTM